MRQLINQVISPPFSPYRSSVAHVKALRHHSEEISGSRSSPGFIRNLRLLTRTFIYSSVITLVKWYFHFHFILCFMHLFTGWEKAQKAEAIVNDTTNTFHIPIWKKSWTRFEVAIWMWRLCGSDHSFPCSVWHSPDTIGGGGIKGLSV